MEYFKGCKLSQHFFHPQTCFGGVLVVAFKGILDITCRKKIKSLFVILPEETVNKSRKFIFIFCSFWKRELQFLEDRSQS